VADFVGRASEIEQLTQALASGSGAAAITGIRGMGGIGKTELALVVAQQLAPQFPDAQLVVELFGASEPVSPEAALQSVIRAFEPQAKLPNDLPSLKQLYAACLHGKRALILADDAKDAAQVRPLLPPAGCALLVTSRMSFTLPGMQRLNLGTLDASEAEKLLLEIEPRIGEDAPALAHLCGYLPLALRVSAELLANDETRSVPRYLEQLQAERLRHLADPDNPDDPAASVAASLALSYAVLPADAQQVFAQLGVFVGDFPLAAAEAVVDQPLIPDHRPLDEVLNLLTRRSLLEYDATAERYALHDLSRAFALARLPDERPTRLRHARYYQKVANHVQKELYLKGKVLEGLALFDRERRQIDAGWHWARYEAKASGGEEAIDHLLIGFANATAYVGDLRYDLRRERITQLKALAAAGERLSRKDAQVMAFGNLGLAYDNLGEYQRAIECHEQALVISREIGDRRGEGNALGNLGIAYDNLGDYHKSIEYMEQVLVLMREIGDRRGEGNALSNLGNDYDNLGEYQRAIEYHEQALVISREIGDRRGEGNALSNLGSAYDALGDYARAIEYYEHRLVVGRAISDVQGVSIGSWNLGLLYAAQGDLARAVPLMQVYVDFLQQIGHSDTEKSVARLSEIRAKLAGQSASSSQEHTIYTEHHIQNPASNQGAQGVFYGPVYISKDATADRGSEGDFEDIRD
jgi:tetratricopeptide (TPR) repeat protein